jgi:hypothetical protein
MPIEPLVAIGRERSGYWFDGPSLHPFSGAFQAISRAPQDCINREKARGHMSLEGKQLRYLIGGDDSAVGKEDEIIELGFDAEEPPKLGIGVKYCNLFDEKYDAKKKSGNYGPYLTASDTAKKYGEGQIDPRGPGWSKNLDEQFTRAKKQGFAYIELDNPDAYSVDDVVGAVDRAEKFGLKVIAKNPGLVEGDRKRYVGHRNVVGMIVEKDAGTPEEMDALRRAAGKPTLPVWFVAFGGGKAWAQKTAEAAARHKHMGVTYSTKGEYANATDVLMPVKA